MRIAMLRTHSFHVVCVPYLGILLQLEQTSNGCFFFFKVFIVILFKASCGSISTVMAYPVLLVQVHLRCIKFFYMQLAAVNRIILL